jgi:hypothetical protein
LLEYYYVVELAARGGWNASYEDRRMVGMFGEKVSLGQAKGPDVQLVVRGTELYGTYETPEGFPAIHDDALGLFCYARLQDGRFVSTGIPVTQPPPSGVSRHETESDDVRKHKIQERALQMARRSRASPREE